MNCSHRIRPIRPVICGVSLSHNETKSAYHESELAGSSGGFSRDFPTNPPRQCITDLWID